MRGLDHSLSRALASEKPIESLADNSEIRIGDTERSSGHGDLIDEVTDLCGGEVHEFVHLVHAVGAGVDGEISAHVGAAEKTSEVGVEMSEEDAGDVLTSMRVCVWDGGGNSDVLLHAGVIISRLVVHEWLGSTSIEEVLGYTTRATSIGGSESSVEVRCEIDGGAVELSRCEDTWYCDADVGLGVCLGFC